MKPIETVLELPRDFVVAGFFGGVPAALLACSAWGLGSPWWGPALVVGAILAWNLRRRVLPLALVAGCLPTLGLSGLAFAMHRDSMNPRDRDARISHALPSRHIAIDELDRRIAWGDDDVSQEVIELPSTRPTWREVERALAPYGYRLQIRGAPLRVHILPVSPNAG